MKRHPAFTFRPNAKIGLTEDFGLPVERFFMLINRLFGLRVKELSCKANNKLTNFCLSLEDEPSTEIQHRQTYRLFYFPKNRNSSSHVIKQNICTNKRLNFGVISIVTYGGLIPMKSFKQHDEIIRLLSRYQEIQLV